MEERIPTLHISEKYIVLVAAVRLLKDEKSNIEKIQKILDLPAFWEEPFHYTSLYANLIQAIIDKEALEFIDNFLYDIESKSMYYDDIEANFLELRDYRSKIYLLVYKIEEQLMHKVYLALDDTYGNHKEKVMDYMRKNQILKGITVYKDKGIVVNKKMMFLDNVVTLLLHDIDKMEKLAFHL